MGTPYWWLLANLQRYSDSSIFFVTGGLGTNPHLPGTACILGNCTALSNNELRLDIVQEWEPPDVSLPRGIKVDTSHTNFGSIGSP
jgi:hypothetical protein